MERTKYAFVLWPPRAVGRAPRPGRARRWHELAASRRAGANSARRSRRDNDDDIEMVRS